MLLPNTDSFVLIRRSIGKPSFFVFLPNNDSFRLTKKMSQSRKEILGTTQVDPVRSRGTLRALAASNGVEELANNVKDFDRRIFLKVLGMSGLGLAATFLFPKKADALILGGTPTSSVVGVKNAANTRINPATEETVSTLLKPTDLTFDAGGELQVKITSVSGEGSSSFSDQADEAKSGLVDVDRHVQVDVLSSALSSTVSTETTLQTISFGGFKFALLLETDGNIDYVGEATIGTDPSDAAWRIKRIDSNEVNGKPSTIIQWAGTDPNYGLFDQVWENRASLTYA